MLSIIFGLMSALAWGGGDFAGGLSSRRIGALLACFFSELLGLGLLLVALPFVREPFPPLVPILLGLSCGALGSFALMLLYHAMASGQMSIAASVSALLAAVVPIVVGAFTEGLPRWLALVGFACALAAVWLISQEEGDGKTHLTRLADLHLPLLAGLGFGMYFVMMHEASREATLWPMIASRTGGSVLLLAFVLTRRQTVAPRPGDWLYIIPNAVLDVGGNVFYVLAGQAGRMDVAAVLGALYPGGTVLLAWLFLKEKISRKQGVGILLALAAIVLMTV